MKKLLFLALILIMSNLFIACQSKDNTQAPKRHIIIPQVDAIAWQSSYFGMNKQTYLVAQDSLSQAIAAYAQQKLQQATGYPLPIQHQVKGDNYIAYTIDNSMQHAEGYQMEVTEDHIQIKAATKAGLFYGFQSLLQLLPPEIESTKVIAKETWKVPGVLISDAPRFPYRGMHLDVCRHFVPLENIKKHLDMMAMCKLNRFHWHLTEDQAWRIEIKAFPKLTKIGSQRTEGEGHIHKGFYTQEDIKEIVAYAQERMIEVIPEIELPGHALAALTAYPEYSCTGGPFKVRNIWGVEADVYCAGKEETFAFLETIIDEVCTLFPSQYFHIGGDECPKDKWKTCKLCQKRIRQEGLKDPHELQSYFVQRIEKILLKHGKKMIGWDEILEGGLAETATVMSWRGESGGIAAAEQNHDVIMTPGNWCYLDHYQGSPKVEPVAIGGYTTLEESYSYNPVPDTLSPEKRKHILGTQGNIWTEYMYTPDLVEYRAYPRIIALAEVGWTPANKRNFIQFVEGLENNLHPRMDYHHINYHIPLPEGPCNHFVFTDTAYLEFSTMRPIKMVYTTDGSTPNAQSKIYQVPLQFTQNTTLKIASVLPHGKISPIRTISVVKEGLAPASKPKATKPGLMEAYAKGDFKQVSDIKGIKKWKTSPTQQVKKPQDWHIPSASILTGYIDIPQDGVYEFNSDIDQVFVDDKLLIDNDKEVKRYSRHNAMRALAKGKHAIKLVSLNNIMGGWPSAWNERLIYIRKAGDKDFIKVRDSQYSH